VSYTIEFVGTRRGADLGVRTRYVPSGDEIYVRARITSSRPHPNPFAAGDREMARTPPLVVSP
jgi:hypothetical protein